MTLVIQEKVGKWGWEDLLEYGDTTDTKTIKTSYNNLKERGFNIRLILREVNETEIKLEDLK